ncbi:MAG: Ig-like domain-containing protein [Prolixibacteraceae bacterium]|nr:Ig-like domain-containing protein [Prolixibacteraceae bacterium]
MRIKGKIPYIIVAAFAWIVIVSSCANIGMPTGGAKDTIPPVLTGTSPEFAATNFNGNEVRFTFNEYLNIDDVSENLVVSPPLERRPIIRTKSKTLIVRFDEELKDSTTYSLDFKNSIADNNEINPYQNMRFSFSTGPVYDSLRVAGRVMDAFTMELKEKELVLLHRNLHDSAIYTLRPDYIAKTDEQGIFMIDNISPGKYNLFALNDANNNFMYDEGAEQIAFVDSLIIPSAEYVEELDTLISGVDSFLVYGHTHFHPEPIYLRHFTEDIFEQYLKSSDREAQNKCIFVFNESVKDTFSVNLVNYESAIENWYLLEYNENVDSLIMWIADTTLAKMDTLQMEISYFLIDSTDQVYLQKDTVTMNFTAKIADVPNRRRNAEEEEKKVEIQQFEWQIKNTATLELNKGITIVAPEPIKSFNQTMVKLFYTNDTLQTPLKFNFEKDTSAWRTYTINYNWEPDTKYTLEIDSAASTNIYGITSKELSKSFTSRSDDYYGSLNLILSGIEMPIIIQLLKNSNEEVLYERTINKDGSVLFDYLVPEKLKIKIIYDRNGNGKWDTGSYQDKYQPERVAYMNQVHKVRSNFDEEITWDITPDPSLVKNIRDLEEEEKRRKDAEEKARQEREQENRIQPAQNLLEGGGTNIFR